MTLAAIEYPTPNPQIKTLSPFLIFLFIKHWFIAIGIVEETVLPNKE